MKNGFREKFENNQTAIAYTHLEDGTIICLDTDSGSIYLKGAEKEGVRGMGWSNKRIQIDTEGLTQDDIDRFERFEPSEEDADIPDYTFESFDVDGKEWALAYVSDVNHDSGMYWFGYLTDGAMVFTVEGGYGMNHFENSEVAAGLELNPYHNVPEGYEYGKVYDFVEKALGYEGAVSDMEAEIKEMFDEEDEDWY